MRKVKCINVFLRNNEVKKYADVDDISITSNRLIMNFLDGTQRVFFIDCLEGYYQYTEKRWD